MATNAEPTDAGWEGLMAALTATMQDYAGAHWITRDQALRGAVGFMGTVITMIAVEQGLSAEQQSLLRIWVQEALGLLPTLSEAPDAG